MRNGSSVLLPVPLRGQVQGIVGGGRVERRGEGREGFLSKNVGNTDVRGLCTTWPKRKRQKSKARFEAIKILSSTCNQSVFFLCRVYVLGVQSNVIE